MESKWTKREFLLEGNDKDEKTCCTYACTNMVREEFLERYRELESRVRELEAERESQSREDMELRRQAEIERGRAEDWKLAADVLREAEESLRQDLRQEQKKGRRELEIARQREEKEKAKATAAEKRCFQLQNDMEKIKDEMEKMEKDSSSKYTMLEQQMEEKSSEWLLKEHALEDARKQIELLKEELASAKKGTLEPDQNLQSILEITKKQLKDALAAAAEEREKFGFIRKELDSLKVSSGEEGNSQAFKILVKEVESLNKELQELKKLKSKMEQSTLLHEKLQSALERAERAEQVLASYEGLEGELRSANESLVQWRRLQESRPGVHSADDMSNLLAQYERELAEAQSAAEAHATEIAILSARNKEISKEKEAAEFQAKIEGQKAETASSSVARAEKRCALLAQERDGLQSLLESYQKEATEENPSENEKIDSTQYSLTLQRIAEAEKCLREKELHIEVLGSEIVQLNSRISDADTEVEAARKIKHDLDNRVLQLEKENESLFEQIDVLIQRVGRGDFNQDTTKVVHLTRNPELNAQFTMLQQEADALKSENKALKDQLGRLEGAEPDKGFESRDTDEEPGKSAAKTVAVFEAERIVLQHRVAELEKRESRYKGVFKDRINAYREACYLLFGFRLDMGLRSAPEGSGKGSFNTFSLRSMYAERESDELKFEQQEDGSLSLVPTDYSATLQREVDAFIHRFGSIPAFLANMTMESFNRQTSVI